MSFEWLSKIQVPLSVAVSVIATCIAGYVYLSENYVHAADFRQFQKTIEQRGLERDKQSLEREVLKLEVKKDAYPQKFDAVDKAMLKKQRDDLGDVKKELNELKTRSLTK